MSFFDMEIDNMEQDTMYKISVIAVTHVSAMSLFL